MYRPWTASVLLAQVLTLSTCAYRDRDGSIEEGTIELRPVVWSTDSSTLGKVSAVADSQEDVAVFGNLGAALWIDGVQQGSDPSVMQWRTAAVVPALDLPDRWLLGVDSFGQVYRLRGSGMIESVSAQYGLLGKAVREVVALNSALTAFALSDKIAVVNGSVSSVRFFDIQARGLSGAAGRLAAFDSTGVIQIDFTKSPGATMMRLPLEGVLAVAFDVTGQEVLVAATEQSLYVERNGALTKIWDVPDESKITGLTGSGRGVWVAIGNQLALLHGSKLLHGNSAVVPESARLVGSPSGDVWVLGGPQLVRLGERTQGGSDEDRWRRNILPLFQRLCRSCHLPGGSANSDLSTYSQWATRRALMKQRLIEQQPKPMPPPEVGTLTPAEFLSVQRWAQRGS